ncbi:MAG: HesA/MoeB/ThiF family protein [Caulobacterales bacterium]
MALDKDELDRYARHILLREIGGPGQQALKRAKIAIVGMGGLGAPAALYLAAAGVGTLRLIDHDAVSISNLQRQILYRTKDVTTPKVESAKHSLAALNPHVAIETNAVKLTHDNARALLNGVDLVLDGTDDFSVRFAVNAACHDLGITLVSGAVGRWDGQLGVFKSGRTKAKPQNERLPCYQCLVPEEPPMSEPCSLVGVVGALTGVIGSLMALEAIKEITDAGQSLAGRLMIFDGLAGEGRTVKLPADPDCPICGAHE